MQAQQSKPTHGKPSRANPPTHGFSKKKKKKNKQKNRNETYPLCHGHVAAEITEKINPRQFKDYNQNKIKTYQKKSKSNILSSIQTLYQKKKTKKNPNTDSVPKRKKSKTQSSSSP